MLQEDGCCQRINFSFPITRRSTHFANCSKRGGSCKAFIDQLDRKSRSSLQFFSKSTNVGGALRVVAILVERQAQHKAARLERGSASNEFRDRHPLSRTALNETGGRGDHPQRIADRKPDSPLAIVDGQKPSPVTRHECRARDMTHRRARALPTCPAPSAGRTPGCFGSGTFALARTQSLPLPACRTGSCATGTRD